MNTAFTPIACLAGLLAVNTLASVAAEIGTTPAASLPPASGYGSRSGGVAIAKWDVDISGGTMRLGDKRIPAELSRVINELREKYPANIALAPGVDKVVINDLKLGGFRWDRALEAMRVASGDAFTWTRQSGDGRVDPTTGLPSSTLEDQELFLLHPNPGANRAVSSNIEVFNLSDYLHSKSAEEKAASISEVQDLLRSTLDQVAKQSDTAMENPSIRYHSGAQLLVLTGTPDALAVARKVLLALPGVSSSRAQTPYVGEERSGRYGAPVMGDLPIPPGAERNAFLRRYGLEPMPPVGAPGQATAPNPADPRKPQVAPGKTRF